MRVQFLHFFLPIKISYFLSYRLRDEKHRSRKYLRYYIRAFRLTKGFSKPRFLLGMQHARAGRCPARPDRFAHRAIGHSCLTFYDAPRLSTVGSARSFYLPFFSRPAMDRNGASRAFSGFAVGERLSKDGTLAPLAK